MQSTSGVRKKAVTAVVWRWCFGVLIDSSVLTRTPPLRVCQSHSSAAASTQAGKQALAPLPWAILSSSNLRLALANANIDVIPTPRSGMADSGDTGQGACSSTNITPSELVGNWGEGRLEGTGGGERYSMTLIVCLKMSQWNKQSIRVTVDVRLLKGVFTARFWTCLCWCWGAIAASSLEESRHSMKAAMFRYCNSCVLSTGSIRVSALRSNQHNVTSS
jgi:hypothetical protein